MLIIIIIRVAILVTFILLVIGVPAFFVWAIRFAVRYERRHRELEVRIEALERRGSVK